MTTKEAAKRWHCGVGTVRKYISTGMIPDAEKIGRKWEIPDRITEQPLTRHKACVLMKDIKLTREGARPQRNATMKEYQFLADNGFITDISGYTTVRDVLQKARVTTEGEKLISAEEESKEKKKVKTKTTIKGEAGVKLGVISAKGEITHDIEKTP